MVNRVNNQGSHDNRVALSRARGLGSARAGVGHWRWQRVTAVALVPLVVWSLASLIAVIGGGREAVVEWLASPGAAIPMILLLIALFWHIALGLTVVAEDYLHHIGVKIATVAVIQFGCLALGVAGVAAMVLAMAAA
jgi:succinate dehydrogenase / fumarate reductase membrane anchor subunit